MPRAASLSQAARDGSYYAVRVGRQAGIYRTWDECKANVHAFPGAVFKKFNSLPEAQTFAGPQASIDPAAPVAQATAPGRTHRTVPYTLDNSRSARNTDNHVRSDAQRKAGDGKTGRVGRVNRVSESVTHPQTPPPLAGETADRIVVYTDGASSNNGKKGARAGVGVYFGAEDPRNISEPLPGPRQTNQRAELMAVLCAIEAVSKGGAGKTLVICTDSMYSINCVNVWHHKWQSCGWVNSQGQQVNNQDLIRAILDRTKAYSGSIQYIHVRGHSGIHGNEQADRLAVQGANTVILL